MLYMYYTYVLYTYQIWIDAIYVANLPIVLYLIPEGFGDNFLLVEELVGSFVLKC